MSLHYNLAGDIVNASPSLPEGIILKPPPLIEKKTPGRFRPNMVRIRWLHCYALIGIGKCIKIRYFKIWNKSKPWKKRSMNSLTWEAATEKFRKFRKCQRIDTCVGVSFNVTGLQGCKIIKKRLQMRCFPVKWETISFGERSSFLPLKFCCTKRYNKT